MTCKYPWKQFWHGEYTNKGKKLLHPYRIADTDEEILVPCGRCMACRINYGRQWAVRCVCEAKEHEESYFLTMTIDDKHVKDILDNVGKDNLVYVPTIDLSDISRFMKALRQSQKRKYDIDGIRFLSCGEYGSRSFRSHYHAIIFGLHLDDLKPYTKSSGYWLYTSKYLDNIWEKGEIYVGEVTAESAQYVAKYAVKNTDEYHELCDALHVNYPGLRMSRRPGIGKHYFETHKKEILANHGVYIHGKLVPVPDYWLDNSDSYDVDLMEYESYQKKMSMKDSVRINGIPDPDDLLYLGIRRMQDEIHARDKI